MLYIYTLEHSCEHEDHSIYLSECRVLPVSLNIKGVHYIIEATPHITLYVNVLPRNGHY